MGIPMPSTTTRAARSLGPYVWVGLAVLSGAIAYLGTPASDGDPLNSPGFWPVLATVVMAGAGVATVVSSRLNSGPGPTDEQQGDHAEHKAVDSQDEKPVRPYNHLYLPAVLATYILVLPYGGYIPSTVVMALVLAMLLGVRRFYVGVIVSIGFTAMTTLIFAILMNIPLPSGRGAFVDINAVFF